VVSRSRWRDPGAFSLVETLIVCALLSTLASIAAGIYVAALLTAPMSKDDVIRARDGAFLGLAADV
jgi:type II secretory pathway pseudopilin PulG